MPINFELTFTQPFLAQLDTGQPRGSKDMAKFITNNYVRTMLTGIPGGGSVPPVLPAPGLSTPAGPPPFPIPSVPINNFASRQRAMQRILQTYFEAREVLIMQGTIKSMIKSIALLVKKSYTLYKQIQGLLQQAADIQRQLAELPLLLEEIKNALLEVVDTERQRLDRLFLGLDKFRLQLGGVRFEAAFANELRFIETIRNFKVTAKISDYGVLIDILNQSAAVLSSIPDTQDGDDIQVYKKMFYEQIRGSLTTVVTLANTFVDPSEYIGYIRGLADFNQKLRPVLDILYRYEFIRRKLEPQLIKLKRKVNEKLAILRSKVEKRIAEEKKKLKDKMKALATKRQGAGKKSRFLKAGKIISDFKKNYLKKIQKAKQTISDVQKVVASAQRLIADTTQFKRDLEKFAESGLQRYIEETKADIVNTTQPLASSAFIEGELNKIYRQIGLFNPVIIRAINSQLVGKVTSPTVLLEYLASKPLDLLTIIQTFTRILNDLEELIKAVQRLTKKNDPSKAKGFVGPPSWPGPFKEPTTGDAMIEMINQIENELNKIELKIRDFTTKQRVKLNKVLNKIKEDIKMKLIMLVPIKSDLKDGKTRAEILKAKKDKIKDTKTKIQKTVKRIAIVNKNIIPGAANLGKNLTSGKWRYSDNQGWINRLIDGVYDLKIMNAASKSDQKVLNEKRRKLKTDFGDYLFGFELLVDLMIKISNEMENTDFLKVFGDKLKQHTIQGYVDLYNKVKQIPTLKKAKMIDIVNFFSDTNAFRVLNSTYIRTTLSDCERYYLTESRAFLQQFASNPLILRLFPGLDVDTDNMLIRVSDGIKYIAGEVKKFLEKLYKITVKPLIDWIQKKVKKVKEDIQAWLKEHVVKRALNLDLKLMSLAFNLATRAFWTGFSWLTPNGVRYTCISIGPFMPLMTKPDAGASALVRELSRNLNLQLTIMNGLVSPPPPTGIPPFPYVGYR